MSEIRLWRANYNTKHERHKIEHWYWAQIAMEVRRASYLNKRSWQAKDFLIKFEVPKPLEPMSIEEQKAIIGPWFKGLRALGNKSTKGKQ